MIIKIRLNMTEEDGERRWKDQEPVDLSYGDTVMLSDSSGEVIELTIAEPTLESAWSDFICAKKRLAKFLN